MLTTTLFFFKRCLVFSSDVQLAVLSLTALTFTYSDPPFSDHFEAPPNQFHCGRPLEPPPGPCSGWSMPHRRSKYPTDSRQTMEPHVSNGGMLFHISLCPYGVIVLHFCMYIFTLCCESHCFLFSVHFKLNVSTHCEIRLEAAWKARS